MNLPPDPEQMNEERSRWADDCIAHFMSTTGCDRDDAPSDLLCDLMHWCDRNGMHWENELERAHMHYNEETTPLQRETLEEEKEIYV